MRKKSKGMLSMLLCTSLLLGVCPIPGTVKTVQAADVIRATSSNVEYKAQTEAIITANAEWGYVKVEEGATVGELVGDITETGAEISVNNQENKKKTNGVLTSTDHLVVKKGGNQTEYDVIVMGDTSATGIIAKKTDDYEFGMLGSNIGTIEDNTITLIDGKVRQLKHDDVDSKEEARKVNLSDYNGDVGRRQALRNANEIVTQLESVNGTKQSYKIQSSNGKEKTDSKPVSGDKLVVTAADGKTKKTYDIKVEKAAVSGKLELNRTRMTEGVADTLVLDYYAGQRSPEATVEINLPMAVKEENISVNLIGRGDVPFADFGDSTGKLDENGYFENESMHAVIGRFGSLWKYKTLGTATLVNGGKTLRFTMLDLRANNGVDLRITIENVRFDKKGDYGFSARYTTAGSDADKALSGLSSVGGSSEQAVLTVDNEIGDLVRLPYNPELGEPNHTYKDGGVTGLSYLDYSEMGELYTSAYLQWTPAEGVDTVDLYQAMGTVEKGGNVKPGDWKRVGSIENNGHYTVKNLTGDRYYQFKLVVQGGAAKGESNVIEHYSGKLDADVFGAAVDGNGANNRNAVNKAIDWLSTIGGGTVNFKGNGNNDKPSNYPMGTLHLKDNVYLYVEKGARIIASKNNMDMPESAWFHYRDLNGDENGAFYNTENFLSKQDDGHSNFRNCMFFAMRAENIKIIGNGRLGGDKVIKKGDGTVNNNGGIDKMIAFKLCNNVEVGGINTHDDLKYDTDKAGEFSKPDARPYYEKAGNDLSNMLYIDRNGHFAMLSTTTDNIHLHDTFISRYAQDDYSRDAFDFMQNRNVYVTNIFSMQSSDDIVKLGSECSMGFTRPAWNYRIRNIIGDSYCNNFQLGSETADDIRDVYVDNLVVLGSNKAGFSISANDGALVKNVNLNTGKTGTVFKESGYFQKSNTSIFISVSHRGRVIGAEDYTTPGKKRAIRNVPIGHVDQVTLKDVKIVDAFSGSLYNAGNGPAKYNPDKREDEKNDDEYTPVVVGYKMPDGVTAQNMPDGRNIGYITNVTLENIDLTVKGYNQNGNYKFSDTKRTCDELDVGQFNSRNMGVRPSYGFYVRHAKNVTFKNCKFDFEGTNGGTDDRYPIVFDDVKTATLDSVTMAKGNGVDGLVQMRDTDNVSLKNCSYFEKTGNGSTVSVSNAEGLKGGTEQRNWGVYLNGNTGNQNTAWSDEVHYVEGEQMNASLRTEPGDIQLTTSKDNGSEQYIEYTSEKQGDAILLDFDIPENGYYSISTVIKKGNRASVQGKVDDTNVGGQIDLGASDGLQDVSTELNCGKTGKFFLKQVTDSLYMEKGTHTFAFHVTKESAEGGVVLHSLRFQKVADAPEGDRDEPSTEKKDEPSTEDKDEPSTEDKDEPSTEDKDEPSTEDKDEPSTEDKEESSTEDKDEPSTEDKDEPSTEDKDEPSTEDKDAPSTEDRDDPSTEDKDDPSTEDKDEPSTEDKEETSIEDKDDPSTEDKEEPSTEDKEEPSTEKQGDSSTDNPSHSSTEKPSDSSADGTGEPSTEEQKAQTGGQTSQQQSSGGTEQQKNNTQQATLPTVHATVEIEGIIYEVTKSDAQSGEVHVKSISKAQKKMVSTLTIPDTIEINGYTFRVKEIAKNAFRNCKKLKKVIIGRNVTKIGANAFANNKKLKTIQIKSTVLKSIGRNVLKGTDEKLVLKVSKKKLKTYKKLWAGKGNKSVKVGTF